MKFKQFLLAEIFNSWKYQVPTDKEHLLFDFYALTLINPSRRPEKEGGVKLVTGREFDENLAIEFENAKEKLCDALIKEFKYTLLYSLSAEMRHILGKHDHTRWHSDHVLSILGDEISGEMGKITKRFINLLDEDNNTSETPTRKESYKAMKELSQITPPNKIAEFCKTIFMSRWWDNVLGSQAYGGKAWGMIADAYAKLYTVNALGDKIVLIDHIYDLQHNNGSVFTKLPEYAKDGDYSWLKKALDYKRDLKQPMALYHRISPGLQGPFAYALYTTTGKSLEKHEKEIAQDRIFTAGDVVFVKNKSIHAEIYKKWKHLDEYYFDRGSREADFKKIFSKLSGKRIWIDKVYSVDQDDKGKKHNQYRIEYTAIAAGHKEIPENIYRGQFLVYDDIFDLTKAVLHNITRESFLKLEPPIKYSLN